MASNLLPHYSTKCISCLVWRLWNSYNGKFIYWSSEKKTSLTLPDVSILMTFLGFTSQWWRKMRVAKIKSLDTNRT